MSAVPIGREDPDRIYVITGGRTREHDDVLDLVTLIVAEDVPAPGAQSEHAEILRLADGHPMAVVELSAHLDLPVTVVKILLRDLRDTGRVTARHPTSAPARPGGADLDTLKQVLVGLQNL